MAENQQIGFTLSVKSEQFVRAMKEVEESRKRVDRVFAQSAASKGDGLLGLGRTKQAFSELRAVSREYEAIKRSMDAQVAAGKQVSDQERQRLRVLESQRKLLQSEISQSRGMGAVRAIGSGITRASSFAGGAAQFALGNPAPMVNALSVIPLLGPGLGMIAASVLQQYAMGKPILMQNLQMTSMARALTGMGGGYLRGAGNFGLSLAYSRAQTLQMLGMYGQSAGGVGGFNTSLMMRRGYGLDTNDMVSSARHMSLETAKSVQLALVRGIESGAFNRALAKEFASASGSLMAQIVSAGGAGSANNITALMGLMSQRLGGIYERSPQKIAGVLGGVNQALLGFASGQGGDAKQAFMFEALRAANPKMSYIDLAMQAERGVSDPRNLSAVLNMIRRRYQGRKMQALAFSRLTGRSINEGYDVMGMEDISPEEVAHRLTSGAPEQALKRRAREGMKGMGIVQRENYLNEKRAALAAKADPMMAKYNELQMRAVDKMGEVVGRLEKVFNNGDGLTGIAVEAGKAAGEIIANAIKGALPSWMGGIGGFVSTLRDRSGVLPSWMGGIGGFVGTLRNRSAPPSRPSPSKK